MVLGRIITLLGLLFLGSAISSPTDEYREHTRNGAGDYLQRKHKILRYIVPAGYSQPDMIALIPSRDDTTWQDLMKLNPSYVEKGTTTKGLTFNIYDDDMREAAIALYRIFETTQGEVFKKVRDWAKNNINSEMYMYALRLESLYSSKTNESSLFPPFIWNPNFFVNAEALDKASLVANEIMSYGKIEQHLAKVNQYSYASAIMKEFVIINTNYSMWNLPMKSQDNLNYFREDVGLNSHYLGIHLMHPFWMSNEELEYNNPRYAEHYYYAHQQLLARYNLEKLHLEGELKNYVSAADEYIPYLKYKNGLPFPTRSCSAGDWAESRDYLKTIDIAIRECVSRGLIIMENGTMIPMTDDTHINILAKLIRANLDSVKVAKIARAIIGYGGHTYSMDEYNAAPSVLHHPETSLRDPGYWFMIQHTLKYFTDYKKNMEPFDLSQYECEDFYVMENEFSKITTYFDYFSFSVNHATSNTYRDVTDWPAYLSVRQRRLASSRFMLNFTVESSIDKETVVRLYLGPQCGNNCWDEYDKFYEIDTFTFTLNQGANTISWSPDMSKRLSSTADYNTPLSRPGFPKYSILRFPENLLIPHGHKEGLNLTLFLMLTPADVDDRIPYPPTVYRQISKEFDSKPLGFPFHRKAKGFIDTANNYRFYNITIYHDPQPFDNKGHFSPYLY